MLFMVLSHFSCIFLQSNSSIENNLNRKFINNLHSSVQVINKDLKTHFAWFCIEVNAKKADSLKLKLF